MAEFTANPLWKRVAVKAVEVKPETVMPESVEEPERRSASPTKPSPKEIDYSLSLSERIRRYKKPLTPQQLADEVGVHRVTIYEWKKANKLPWRPAGRHIKFEQAATAEWAAHREFTPPD
jgi:excisionase family DNA binding protein